MSTHLCEGSTEPNSVETNILRHHLFYTNKNLKNYPFIHVGKSISIITCKLTKKFSHIISNRLLSSCSLYYGNNQRSKLEVELSSMHVKHIELFYRFIGRLLSKSGITVPDVLNCVTYVLTMMELPTNYCKNRNLNTDPFFTKKIQIIVLSPTED